VRRKRVRIEDVSRNTWAQLFETSGSSQYRGQKLSDGKTTGGQGRLTNSLINSLQDYYGDAIRRNKGNLEQMNKGV
jgi:hypothetical protein